jgi:hypothetical protein
MIAAQIGGIASKRPGQLSRLCGHASQVAACGSHSAGFRYSTAGSLALAPLVLGLPLFSGSSMACVCRLPLAAQVSLSRKRARMGP